MKFISAQLSLFLSQRGARRNMGYLVRFVLVLLLLIIAYSVLFHYIMAYEGRLFSWVTGVYWTLTVMSTLGFGDITFTSDIGRIFSIFVLMSGVIFLLVMLPFTFIQYFYAPWLEAIKKDHTPRGVPAETTGHVILVGIGPLSANLADDLEKYDIPCVLLCPDTQTTLDYIDQGYTAVLGDYDDGETYRRLHVEQAAMVVALDSDMRNTNIVFTAREVNAQVPITARVEKEDSIDILELAGCTNVFQFHQLLGEALARRVINKSTTMSILARFGELVVVEAPVMRTPLVGKTLVQSNLRQMTGVNVVGVWERGRFSLPVPDMVLTASTVIVAAGTDAHIATLDTFLGQVSGQPQLFPVVILGGGRVGQAAAMQLTRSGINSVIVDKRAQSSTTTFVHGDAAALEVLEKAGIRVTPSVIITTHDDDINIYLTIYVRRLRPDVQIISRATFDRNVGILHAAGADLVISLASMITNTLINQLSPGKLLMLNEGLNIFRVKVAPQLIEKRILDSRIRERTNCSVVAVSGADGVMMVNPAPDYRFCAGDDIYLIGDTASEVTYYERFDGK